MDMITLTKEQIEAVVKGVKDGQNVITIDELQVTVENGEITGWQYNHLAEDWVECEIDEESIKKVSFELASAKESLENIESAMNDFFGAIDNMFKNYRKAV